MITNSVTYCEPEKLLVDAYNSLPESQKSGAYWSDESINPVRSVIKEHYVREQDYCCCYCNHSILSSHGRMWDIEHVVPKSSYPQFLFEPQNLAISCIDCNQIKDNSNILVNPNRKHYPRRSDAFIIVHPHFDDYKDHIVSHFGLIYTALSEKGEQTIYVCGLGRFAYKYGKWDERLLKNQPLVDIFHGMMEANDEATAKEKLKDLLILALVRN